MLQSLKDTMHILNSATDFITKLIRAYYKMLHWLTKKDYENRSHFVIRLHEGKLTFRYINHDTYILEKCLTLGHFKELYSGRKLVEFLINECKGCNFFVLYTKRKTFVQFWLDDGKLELDWPLLEKNNLQKHTYGMLGVLNELHIHGLQEGMKPPKRVPYYSVESVGGKFDRYTVNFQNYPKEAIEFTLLVFEKVFNEDINKLKVELG